MNEEFTIEDPRNHPPAVVDTLRQLLAGGVRLEEDPKRPGFYELQHDGEVYYIHISPITGNILLLATWSTENLAPYEAGTTQAA